MITNQNFISSIHNRFSVAPMLNWTDRHCRFFLRRFSKKTLLYTEMITTDAIIHGKKNFFIYNEEEIPLSFQIGGNNPSILAKCAKMAQNKGYSQINFNLGCPSKKVANGLFGAYLMKKKKLVSDCIISMKESVSIPITIKTRIGIDENNSYEFLSDFIDTIYSNSKCDTFIIHARQAYLNNFSPKKNREIPPLDYDKVYKLKKDFPKLNIIINGGIKNIFDIKKHLKKTDGVMVGREIYKNPGFLLKIDSTLFDSIDPLLNQQQALIDMIPYINKESKRGTCISNIMRHMVGLFKGMSYAKKWRKSLNKILVNKKLNTKYLIKIIKIFSNEKYI